MSGVAYAVNRSVSFDGPGLVAITLAQLNAVPGLLLPVQLPRPPYGGLPMPRFVKLNYTVVGTFTAGALAASLLLNRDDVVSYPSALALANV